MRLADNHAGYSVELHTPAGWTAISAPYSTQALAQAVMKALQAVAPSAELRVYEALARRAA